VGLNYNKVRAILRSKVYDGIELGEVVTIGRQGMHITPEKLHKSLAEFGYGDTETGQMLNGDQKYCESFLKFLGARKIDSIDNSDYENASIIHNMNLEIPEQLYDRYDTVMDSGTLEHVFNYPVAIKNCMQLLKKNGHFIGITPCNNFFGHGFYQFSSELFYRIFSEENGFQIENMILFEDFGKSKFYSVEDSSENCHRIILNNSLPSYLFIIARKIANKEIFNSFPIQFDYGNIYWEKKITTVEMMDIVKVEEAKMNSHSFLGNFKKNLKKILPFSIQKTFKAIKQVSVFSDTHTKGYFKKLG
jgi:hypothetical protein